MLEKFYRDNKNTTLHIDEDNIPMHIAIIMDGNGRWAKQRKLPRTMGHRAGVEALKKIVRECDRLKVKYLTVYAFSTENWQRPKDEVSAIMKLLVQYLRRELDELNKNNVVINNIGDTSGLPELCARELINAYNNTKDNTGLVLNLAFNYGGRAEIIRAFKLMNLDIKNGLLSEDDINDKIVSKYLYTKGMPDPDLIIRPSGEQRLSNFLLWQCAYSEFWYSNINWPDFRKEDLIQAIYDYQNRDRRFGKIK
ncbi:isoprenyl transferase [Clostridium tyrobutyricum]|uniref:isoprenyl transferase n=1 Tax=Clostridium tyrobutyricum TaxID=1519 RepID=UPI001C37ED54|nr:isoprenyl transferase [Clostridium tyrobutyricum]MBV4418075.1 isoprenyl transferase [Clostridium tyrobutyricum]